MALADVYDALTSRRVYRKRSVTTGPSPRFVEEAGIHFDPATVEAFLAHERQFIALREQYADADNEVPEKRKNRKRLLPVAV